MPPEPASGVKLDIAVPTVKFFAGMAAAVAVGADATVKLTEFVVGATTLLASLTSKTTLAVLYGPDGVPATWPVDASKVRPGGRMPELT